MVSGILYPFIFPDSLPSHSVNQCFSKFFDGAAAKKYSLGCCLIHTPDTWIYKDRDSQSMLNVTMYAKEKNYRGNMNLLIFKYNVVFYFIF